MISETWMDLLKDQLPEGAFLMVKGNPMTIGWAQCGILWSREILTVYVRQSRHTHDLLEDCDTFTVSIPIPNLDCEALAYCGRVSGRDEDKVKAMGRALTPARFGAQDGLSRCIVHIECRILYRRDLDPALLDDETRQRAYPAGDPHTAYVGEVLGVYLGDIE